MNSDRYHLYVSYACRECLSFSLHVICTQVFVAWATRTLIMRKLKGLEDIIREAASIVDVHSALMSFV